MIALYEGYYGVSRTPEYQYTSTGYSPPKPEKPHHRLISLVPLRLLKRRRVRYGRAYLRSLCDAR
jgi:hypothetical protein